MAVAPAVAARIARSALAMLETPYYRGLGWVETGAPSRAAAMRMRLLELYRDSPGVNSRQMLSIAQGVVRSAFAGEIMQRDPARDLTRRELPVDRTLLPGDARYRYRTLITRTDASGASQSYVADIDSDVTLNAEQVALIVQTTHDTSYTPGSAASNRVDYVGPGATITSLVISAGRRGP